MLSKTNSRHSSRHSSSSRQQARFITNCRSTIFSSVLSKGPQSNRQTYAYEGFGYDLSPGERHFAAKTNFRAMKNVPSQEKIILTDGKRLDYLMRRYEYAPDDKYNYPEATSWRIGWQHKENLSN